MKRKIQRAGSTAAWAREEACFRQKTARIARENMVLKEHQPKHATDGFRRSDSVQHDNCRMAITTEFERGKSWGVQRRDKIVLRADRGWRLRMAFCLSSRTICTEGKKAYRQVLLNSSSSVYRCPTHESRGCCQHDIVLR